MSDDKPTPDQLAACERAMDGMEARADLWAVEIDLPKIIKNIARVTRGISSRMPAAVRERFIARQEANIDALVKQAFIEGMNLGCTGAFDAVRAGYDPKTGTLGQ